MRSRVWYAMLSSVARTTWARLVERSMPMSSPRAYGSQYGAPRPVNAGTRYRSTRSPAASASASVSAASPMRPSPSLSHCTAAPVTNALPSSAYTGPVPRSHASVASRPAAERAIVDPVFTSRKQPVPYVFFASPGAKHGLAEERGLLIAGDAADRDRSTEVRGIGVAEVRDRRQHLGEHRRRHAEPGAELVVPAGPRDVEEERTRGVRDVGPMRSAAREPPEQPAVDRPEAQLALLRAGLRAADVVEDPADLRP